MIRCSAMLAEARGIASAPGLRKLESLSEAYRWAGAGRGERRVLRRLRPCLLDLGLNAVETLLVARGLDQPPQRRLDRTIILKTPGPGGEKGVLLVMLEQNWLRLLANGHAAAALADEYDLVLSTGWSPTDYALLGLMSKSWPETFFVQSCNYGECDKLQRFHVRLRCLQTIGCDWIDPDVYAPKPFDQREIDILMVANWAPFKRHWHLFDALSRMPRNLRVTLIGQPERGHDVMDAKALARTFGVKQDIEFLDQLPIDEVQRRQENAKTSLILSRREGCCVAVCESLFADSPVGVLRSAHLGPKAYINVQTGMLLEDGRLDRQLHCFLETASNCRPRQWAIEHITCHASAAKLNATLREHAWRRRRPWTRDAVTPCWRPYPRYLFGDDAEAMRPAYVDLHQRLPGAFGMELFTAAAPMRRDSRETIELKPPFAAAI